MPSVADYPDALMHLIIYLVLAGMVLQIVVSIVNLYRGKKKDFIQQAQLDTLAKAIGDQIRLAVLDHKTEDNPHDGKYVTYPQLHEKFRECQEQRRREVDAEIKRRVTHDAPHR